jgi:arylsulfatase A-like enzyme
VELKMQTETDSTVRDFLPGLLDAAGMPREAEEMRRIDMLSETCTAEAAALLRRVRDEAGGRWAPLLQEACFWAEAVIWAAWRGDEEAFEESREAMDRVVIDGLALMAVH